MGRGKENEGETQKLLLSSVVLREDIVNLLDFIERLKNEEDQIVLDTDQIENLKLELTFLSACLQLCYYNSDGSKAKMSCISYEIHDLVQSLFHQSGDDMLVKLKDHVVPCLLENIKTSITSDHHSESSATMTEDQLVELLDALLANLHYLPKVRAELLWPSMTQYELLQNVFGTLRDFHGLKVNGCIEHEAIEYVLPQIQLMAERVGHFCFALLSYQLKTDEKDEDETDEEDKDETDEEDEDEDETDEEDEDETAEEDEDETDEKDEDQVNSMLVRLLLKIIPVSLEVMQICSTMLEASKSAELGCFIKKLLEASPDILREHLIHLQQHMVNAIPRSTSAFSIHVMIEFLLLFLTDMPQDFIHYEKLFVLLARVGALIREVSILIRNLEENSTDEENMNKISCASRDLLENIELLKEDLKNVFLKVPADSSQLCFPMSDGPLFMTLLLRNLNDLLNSNAYSVALIKDEIGWVKEDLEHIRSFFGNVEQELHRDLWTSILDVAYKTEHAINSILARDHGLLQLIFLLPDAIEKIKLVKKEVQEKISKNTSIIFANSPNKPVINKSSIAGKIIVGFEEETEWIIRKLTSGPAEVDVISIVGMPGLGKTTLAYKVYNEKSVVGHFDILAWCTVDQERNEKKLLQKIFNQVMGLKERFNEDDIDDDVADKLRKELFGKRYLVVLDDMWDTATWDELTRPLYAIPSEFQKGSRVILTSRKKEVALHGKCHSDPLDLRLLRPEESWALLEKRVFGEESCPDELRDVGEKISQKCDGLPLVLDLISGVMSRKEKKEVLWLEILNNLSSFIFKDEEEVMKVIQLSYDHLSDHLKPCFLYLASYPKDEDIEFSQLKDLWSSQGLVEQTDLKSVEEVTEVFVDELIASSLIEDYLYQKDLHEPLTEVQPESMKEEKWNLKDRQDLGLIHLTLSKNVEFNIVKEKITFDLLKALSNMYEKPSTMNKGRDQLRGRNIHDRSKSKNHGKSPQKSNVTCWNYGEKGHFQIEYEKPKKKKNQKSGDDNDSVNSVEDIGDALILSVDSPAESWILDSGAAFHSSPSKELFQNFKSGNFEKVYLADKKSLAIEGKGNVCIKSPVGNQWTLEDVRYIPGLKKNMISVGQLDSIGCTVEFGKSLRKIVKGAMVVACGINLELCTPLQGV
ncbi:putative late blight resistance protein homolog R1C-3 [Capsicum annuum]|uniref:putative late blight resistance protein homolog R1C-3 n=1 Tax=Capsicum annuum TaxID=4072 RepID=UPI001FB0AEB8|nr:putative late blight resistance protein homolog R1C-3 [Capsicum annuum]